jgi:chromosome segregation ATPase
VLKARLELETREKLEAEIERLNGELSRQRADKAAVEAEIARLHRFSAYLESVVVTAARGGTGASEQFDEVKDVLSRYETLDSTNRDLHGQASASARELEELRAAVAALQKRMRDSALVSSSGAQELGKKLERARATVRYCFSRQSRDARTSRTMYFCSHAPAPLLRLVANACALLIAGC